MKTNTIIYPNLSNFPSTHAFLDCSVNHKAHLSMSISLEDK